MVVVVVPRMSVLWSGRQAACMVDMGAVTHAQMLC